MGWDGMGWMNGWKRIERAQKRTHGKRETGRNWVILSLLTCLVRYIFRAKLGVLIGISFSLSLSLTQKEKEKEQID